MKKLISATVLSFALLMVAPTAAFAHCHGSVAAAASWTVALCAVENCNVVGNHYHDGVLSAGHYIGDGHDYHQVCDVRNCAKTVSHAHNGVERLPRASGDSRGHNGSRSGEGRC